MKGDSLDSGARVVVFGSASVDLTTYGARLPQPGETVLADEYLRCTGGKGANQAVACALAGARTSFVGSIGRDAFGDEILEALCAKGIEASHVTRCDAPTAVALIMVDSEGRNLITVATGANRHLRPEHARDAARLLDSRTVLVLQLEVPLHSVVEMAMIGRSAGARVILNPAPARPLPAELLEAVDIIVPNELELAALAPDVDLTDTRTQAERLRATGVPVVVATLGAGGVLIVSETAEHIPAHRVRAVDTTGAGDAFVGAMAARLAAGDDLADAVRYANAAAALSVRSRGTQPSFCTDRDVRELLATA